MKNFFSFEDYYKNFTKLLQLNKDLTKKLNILKKQILKCHKRKKKVIIFGNGGSAGIASHFSVDLTKTANIRCVNFADSGLLTCLANDYGYENWVSKAIDFYADDGDLLILISSSGMSKNMLNSFKNSKKKFSFIVTFSGFKPNNKLRKLGDLSFYVNSEKYNYVENVHQIWLLSVIDSIIENQ